MRRVPCRFLPFAASALVFFASHSCFAQQSSSVKPQESAAQAAPFVGCYELRLGRWWPWGMGEDTKFAVPPSPIELTLQEDPKSFAPDWFTVLATRPSDMLRRRGYWLPLVRHRVRLTWTNGFAGATMRLTQHGDGLRGWAHAFFDFPRPPHIAHVTFRPIDCSPAPQ